MKVNIIKYLILILAALFFSSTNELSAKEAEQNFFAESHTFIGRDNFKLEVSFQQHQTNRIKVHTPNPFIKGLGYPYNFFCQLSVHGLKPISSSITNKIYLNISVLRI